ncbi:MAG: hypothetical protein ACJ0RC_05945 [Alphaproteobacteria bacterium]
MKPKARTSGANKRKNTIGITKINFNKIFKNLLLVSYSIEVSILCIKGSIFFL